ncbi:MAG: DNA primase [Gemmatimonadetes bacterium]|nr:DNA primase [Gemmatimonadota bacterium]
MPRIPEEAIDRIRDSVDIVDVVSEYVQLTARGRNHVGLCPFHDDHDPSFNVSQEKQIYKCFVCGAGGNVYTFVREIEGISFVESVRKVAEIGGLPVPEPDKRMKAKEEAFDPLYQSMDLARKYFNHLLTVKSEGRDALDYLKGRGVDNATIEAFSLGYAPKAWDHLLRVATSPKRRGGGFSPEILEKAGLILARNSGNGYYDRFRHRVVFPIRAHTGRVVAFSARALDANEQAKYINSPESPIYHKSAILHGLYEGRDALRKEKRALIVEGQMDHLSLFQFGIENVVATSGTALTIQQAKLLRRYAEHAVLIFDGDRAGMSAASRGIAPLIESGIDVRVVSLPDGQDPDTFIREHGKNALLGVVNESVPLIDFLVSWVGTLEDLTTSDGRARATHHIADLIGRVTDQTLRHLLIRDASERIGIEESVVIQSVQDAQKSPRPRRSKQQGETTVSLAEQFDPRPRQERELLIQLMTDNETADIVLEQIRPEDFTNSIYRQIAKIVQNQRNNGWSTSVAHIVDCLTDDGLARIISSLSLETGISNPDQVELPVQDYINAFHQRRIDRQIEELNRQMRNASADDQIKLMQAHKQLTLDRKAIKEGSSFSQPEVKMIGEAAEPILNDE